MKELHREDWSFILYEGDDGSMSLDVTCGTIAVYQLTYDHGTSEIEKYKKQGVEFIKNLASAIQANPSRYQK